MIPGICTILLFIHIVMWIWTINIVSSPVWNAKYVPFMISRAMSIE